LSRLVQEDRLVGFHLDAGALGLCVIQTQKRYTTAERDRIEKTDPPSIMRDATLKVLEERIQRQIGYCNGLSDVWQLLHQRAYELWELTRLKEERT